jgi:dihydroxy-acid dehydratase
VLRATPRIGVLSAGASGLTDRIREAGGEPVPLVLPKARPKGGVALVREWVADAAEISIAPEHLDALLIAAEEPEDLAGLVLSALRLNRPTVAVSPRDVRLFAASAALGLAPLAADPAEVAIETARAGEPRPLELIEDFSLANALRAAFSLGDGPETIVHLSAIARESGAVGFDQMIRVLVPETPLLAEPGSSWFEEHGVAGLLAHLGDALHDARTVEGRLRELLPPKPPAPPTPAGSRLVFVEGRASGTEALSRVSESRNEVAGECRVLHSEEFAVRGVEGGFFEPNSLLVVGGCGPRGGPGLLRLDSLAQTLHESALEDNISVITDGLPPRDAPGTWISLVSPEAAADGVIGLLRDGDTLRIDLAEGRIRTSVRADELEGRDPYDFPDLAGAGYAARYARSALPALEGAGFGTV